MMETIIYLKPIVDLLGALLSPVVAAVVTYIAYQQWQINRTKTNREIRASEIEIYRAVKDFLRHVDETSEVDPELYIRFRNACSEADFIFNKEVTDWLYEVESNTFDCMHTREIIELSRERALQQGKMEEFEKWKLREDKYIEKHIDFLQIAHCDVLDVFKKICILCDVVPRLSALCTLRRLLLKYWFCR